MLEKVEVILAKGDAGFEKWLRTKSIDELEKVVAQLQLREKNSALDEYLVFIKEHECLGVCSKCKYKTGCVACDYKKALNYTIRNQTFPQWWIQKHGLAVQKASKKKKTAVSGNHAVAQSLGNIRKTIDFSSRRRAKLEKH